MCCSPLWKILVLLFCRLKIFCPSKHSPSCLCSRKLLLQFCNSTSLHNLLKARMGSCTVIAAKIVEALLRGETCYIVPGFGVEGGQPLSTSAILSVPWVKPSNVLVIITNSKKYSVQYCFVAIAESEFLFPPRFMKLLQFTIQGSKSSKCLFKAVGHWPPLCLFSANNDVKDIFASAKSGDQYRALKIVIEGGKCPRVLEHVCPSPQTSA